jgi:hypothetical protein
VAASASGHHTVSLFVPYIYLTYFTLKPKPDKNLIKKENQHITLTNLHTEVLNLTTAIRIKQFIKRLAERPRGIHSR